MSRITLACCFASLLLCSTLVIAQVPPENANYAQGRLGERIAEFVTACETEGFSGVVLAAKDGQVAAAVSAGYADLHGQTPMHPGVLFEIASVTKSFTAGAILRLAEQNRLRLSDSIAEHIPGIPDDCRGITIEHLIRHTSGIPGKNTMGGGDDISRVLPFFLQGGPKHEPGTHWEYWNQGYAILSEVIARAAEQPYTTACRVLLFEPAGMHATCFTGDPAPDGAIVAIGRAPSGPPRSALDHPYGEYGFQYRGMGGIVTNVWDLWRWDRALARGEVLQPESLVEFFKPGLRDYALGWFVQTTPSGRRVQQHGGSVRGFTCEVRRYPDHDAFLAVVCNRNDAPLSRVATAVEEILFEDARTEPWPLRPVPELLRVAMLGVYLDAHGNRLVIESDLGVTRARVHCSQRADLTRHATLGLEGDQLMFCERSGRTAIETERDEKDRVTAVIIAGHRHVRD